MKTRNTESLLHINRLHNDQKLFLKKHYLEIKQEFMDVTDEQT